MGPAQSTMYGCIAGVAGGYDDRRLQRLADDLECLGAVRQRYPTLDWHDFDGAFLVHSSHNALLNECAVIEWNVQAKHDESMMRRVLLRRPARAKTVNSRSVSPARQVSQVAFADSIEVIPRASSVPEPCHNEFSSCNQPLIADGATKLPAECASAQAAAMAAGVLLRTWRRLSADDCPSAPSRLATPIVPYLQGHTPFVKIKDHGDDMDGIEVICWTSTLDCHPSAPSACTLSVSKQVEKDEVFFRSSSGLSSAATRPHSPSCEMLSSVPATSYTDYIGRIPHAAPDLATGAASPAPVSRPIEVPAELSSKGLFKDSFFLLDHGHDSVSSCSVDDLHISQRQLNVSLR